ncbi:MAG: hypothetical protein UT32_C0009G0044 [Parcubacteria group bacterium GW2011_GWC2_39_14]|nr:MAG: hypothetical protein UT32_C0009G0044 [Parcubacteria group bacterium GW2011_GWC2_39_14]KKR55382.1 MAG: hypothetical protein UT91_C0002G0043 [Parcubacteria group bacterium GW2011_GWA2_40_23]
MSKLVDFLKFPWLIRSIREIKILYLIVFVMLAVQTILSALLFMRLEKLDNSFIDYRETSMKRINQIYGQVYSLSSRIENKK